ncbi:MAG: DUF5623 domain-containing protein [Polaromonas sp.]|nr:DUF5623 domain-containing protein [Polaromonas sp.]
MSSEAIQPSSMDGIKRLAKSLKVQRGIQHVRALDDAAQSAGFQNFRHASNMLRGGAKTEHLPRGHHVFITVYWKDREVGGDGRETLTVWLSAPWGDLVTRAQLQNHRALVHFRAEGPDHLARPDLVQSQSHARRMACAAARTLHFMDATKLRPSKSHSRAFPGGRSSNAVPGRDHYSIWYDRKTKRYLFADEPYESAAKSKAAERAAWAQHHGFVIVRPAWLGMYNPDGGSQLYLIADGLKGIPLGPIVGALDALTAPIVEEAWDGESVPTVPIFVSPGAMTRLEAAKLMAEKSPKPSGQRNSVGYVQTFVGPQRRPKGRMPINAHAEVGGLLKSVLVATHHRKGVYNRVNAVRSELDEWTQREYNRAELPSEQFFDLYYHESGSTFSRSLSADARIHHVNSLTRVKQVVAEHYPDSPPLRSLLKNVDAAIKSLQNWTA